MITFSTVSRMRLFFLVFFLALFVLPHFLCLADDTDENSKEELPNFTYHDVTTKEGLVFRVPEDMPIVKRSGILAPLPFDEYVYRKFKKSERELKRVESRLNALEEEVDSLTKEKSRVLSEH